jgi:spoIIIJ-associated protein
MQIQEFTQRLLAHLGIEAANIEVDEGEVIQIHIQVSEEDSGLLIGYHGETLAAIQKIIQLAHRAELEEKKIVININDYRERRITQIQEMVDRIAERILSSGQRYVFPYLPANERLVIHSYIAQTPEYANLESVSTGEGSNRRLEIRLKAEVKS